MSTVIDVFRFIFDFLFHVDEHLLSLSNYLGVWVYLILFLVIFCETGLVFTPFLPGDSFLFATGAMAALSMWDVKAVVIMLILAAILGDTTNYYIGTVLGEQIKKRGSVAFVNTNHLNKAQKFYNDNGAKTVIMARFIPIVRTFAPFIAGVSGMTYAKFLFYSITGAFLWVPSFIFLGYFFGKIPIIANNIGVVGLVIITISVVPVLLELLGNNKGVN